MTSEHDHFIDAFSELYRLTAAVIIDDLVAIGVIAIFYTEAIKFTYLIASLQDYWER